MRACKENDDKTGCSIDLSVRLNCVVQNKNTFFFVFLSSYLHYGLHIASFMLVECTFISFKNAALYWGEGGSIWCA
jgi:hypothetical protein